MYREIIEKYLSVVKKPFTIIGDEVRCSCVNPNHLDSHPSFSINIKSGLMGCFSCGYKNHISNLVHEEIDEETLRNMKYLQILKELEVSEKVIEEPIGYEEHLLPPDSELELPEEGIRGISLGVLKDLGVFYCIIGKYRGRLVFPVRNIDGTLLGFDARIYQLPGTPFVSPVNPNAKYLRPSYMKTKDIVYGVDYIYNKWSSVDYVLLTEGVFDTLSWLELGIPSVCNFGLSSPSSDKIGLLLSVGIQNIANGFDTDTAGIEGWQKIKEDWRQYLHILSPTDEMVKFHRSKFDDVNDYLMDLKERE